MSTEKEHVALPQLVGVASQRRRRTDVEDSWRPLGPDDLPLERFRSPEDDQLADELFPTAYMSRYVMTTARRPFSTETAAAAAPARPRRLSLHAIALKFRGGNHH